MIKASSLKTYTAKDLAQMAKRYGVTGWHSMRKEELIQALTKLNQNGLKGPSAHGKVANGKAATNGKANGRHIVPTNGEAKKPVVNRRLRNVHRKKEQRKDLATMPVTSNGNGNGKKSTPEPSDRVVLMVRDPFWLHVFWELTSRAIIRAKAAMAEQWHSAKPVIRLLKSTSTNSTSASEVVERDIEIHGGVSNWYIDVNDPPKTFRVEIGYLAANGKFFSLARSNGVTTPKTSSSDLVDHNWSDVATNCDKILAQSGAFSTEGNDGELRKLFEERLRRPMGSPMITSYGVGAESLLGGQQDFRFEVDAEMIIFGSTQPDAHVVLAGEPVKIRPDGTFTIRMSMADGRRVLPVVSCSRDGTQQQTIILAVERNTKTMEPVARESA